MADDADILALVGGENITGVATINLGGSLEEPVLGRWQEPGKGDAGVIDAVFAADKIVRHQRPVDERQRMIVDGVDLAEFSAHFADFEEQSCRKGRKGDIAFLDVNALFAKGDEGVGARVRVNDRLHAHFGFMELQ